MKIENKIKLFLCVVFLIIFAGCWFFSWLSTPWCIVMWVGSCIGICHDEPESLDQRTRREKLEKIIRSQRILNKMYDEGYISKDVRDQRFQEK